MKFIQNCRCVAFKNDFKFFCQNHIFLRKKIREKKMVDHKRVIDLKRFPKIGPRKMVGDNTPQNVGEKRCLSKIGKKKKYIISEKSQKLNPKLVKSILKIKTKRIIISERKDSEKLIHRIMAYKYHVG